MSTLSSQTPHGKTPLVSIGLPVFNGELYLARAIDSILNQSLGDLELVICDNASTDRTREICEGYALKDERVRYFRNERNLGAGPNYDLCFHRSKGRYFKWAAHDDMLAPEFLRKAVDALEADDGAVLCSVGVTEIGPDDEAIRSYRNELPGADSSCRTTRLHGVINVRHQCEDFFGLYRRSALVGSGLHDVYRGSDRVLLAEMALRGRFVKLTEPLFLHREHDRRYTRAILADRSKAAVWQDTQSAQKGQAENFHIGVYAHYWRMIRRNIPDPIERWACYGVLFRWWFCDDHAPDVVREFLRSKMPRSYTLVRRVKHAALGLTGLFSNMSSHQ